MEAEIKARVAEYIENHGRASLGVLSPALRVKPSRLILATDELVREGRITKIDATTWAAV
jgi:hypothetical protein